MIEGDDLRDLVQLARDKKATVVLDEFYRWVGRSLGEEHRLMSRLPARAVGTNIQMIQKTSG
jgi:aspartate/methionine/tyrosine aminotransferase